MELDSQRLLLAREILTTDNTELLQEMTRAYKCIKHRLSQQRIPKAECEEDAT
jgi:hypothetical protein